MFSFGLGYAVNEGAASRALTTAFGTVTPIVINLATAVGDATNKVRETMDSNNATMLKEQNTMAEAVKKADSLVHYMQQTTNKLLAIEGLSKAFGDIDAITDRMRIYLEQDKRLKDAIVVTALSDSQNYLRKNDRIALRLQGRALAVFPTSPPHVALTVAVGPDSIFTIERQ